MKRARQDDYSSDSRSSGPPFSRLFLIGKRGQFDDKAKLQEVFEQYGKVKDVYILIDKTTGRDKGIAYIQLSKTSEGAKAIDELDGKGFLPDNIPIKVKPASSRNSSSPNGKEDDEYSKMLRLFVKIPVDFDNEKLKDTFKEFGKISNVKVVTDYNTGKPKGLGFVTFSTAYEAAMAYEECPRSFKPLYADTNKMNRPGNDRNPPPYGHEESYKPYGYDQRSNQRRGYESSYERPRAFFDEPYDGRSRYSEDNYSLSFSRSRGESSEFSPRRMPSHEGLSISRSSLQQSAMESVTNFPHSGNNRLSVKVQRLVSEEMLTQLFSIIPGLDYCTLNSETGEAFVKFKTPQAAAYAKQKLDGFEYPPGCPLAVSQHTILRPPGGESTPDSDEVQQALKVLEAAGLGVKPSQSDTYSSFKAEGTSGPALPPEKPLLAWNADVQERLFIVCSQPLPDSKLYNIFCRFGNLIEIFLVPGKRHGFASYGSKESAQNAISMLHRQEVDGCFMKVVIAEPKKD